MQQLTFEEVRTLAEFQGSPEWADGAMSQMARWLVRGDGIAVYRNEAMGSSSFGHRQFVSFGSKAAQLETSTPPDRLPDIGNKINWAYCLEGVCLPERMRHG